MKVRLSDISVKIVGQVTPNVAGKILPIAVSSILSNPAGSVILFHSQWPYDVFGRLRLFRFRESRSIAAPIFLPMLPSVKIFQRVLSTLL